jgi:4-amino-4-deoxy-L-arabinose transferase-like glycosyltransferase
LLLAFVVLLGLGMVLVIPELSHYHGDEAFYTNAAIRMSQTGDYWTPYYADGSPRFLKPILSYWAITASYSLFGISAFSARLPFALAGCLVVYLTYQLSLILFGRAQSALLAALIAGSNLQLWTLSLRSTPDILVILFVLLSWLGMARIFFRGDHSFVAFLLFYGGAGLAVQTKGLLGLFPIAFAVLFQITCGQPQRNWRIFRHAPAMLLGAALASFWYLAMAIQYGGNVFSQFFNDQLTAKVSFSPLDSVKNLATYLLAGVRHALPWTLIVAVAAAINPRETVALLRKHKRECIFLLGAFLLLSFCFCFSSMRRTRYVAIAYPLLAVLCAEVLVARLENPAVSQPLRRGFKAAAMAMIALALGLALAANRIDPRFWIGAGLIGAGAVALFLATRQALSAAWAPALAGLLVGVFVVVDYCWRPVLTPAPAPELASRLAAAHCSKVYAVGGHSSYLDQMRVCSGGQLQVVMAKEFGPDIRAPFLMTTQPSHLPPNWAVEVITAGGKKWTRADWLALIRASHPSAVLANHKESFYLVRPDFPPPHITSRPIHHANIP